MRTALKKRNLSFAFLIVGLVGVGVWGVARSPSESVPLKKMVPGATSVPIVVYHIIRPRYKSDTSIIRQYSVEPAVFEKELQYLVAQKYTPITPDDLVRSATSGLPLPTKPVMLTFDDGWEMQYKNAFPLLKKYHLTATFYVFTHAIGHKHFLTWEEIKELETAGMTIGGHTKTHPYLARINDQKILRDEIIGSKKILEDHVGHPITAFAVPFGRSNDLIKTIVKEAGFTSLRTMYKGGYHLGDDLFNLKSIEAPDNLEAFIAILNAHY